MSATFHSLVMALQRLVRILTITAKVLFDRGRVGIEDRYSVEQESGSFSATDVGSIKLERPKINTRCCFDAVSGGAVDINCGKNSPMLSSTATITPVQRVIFQNLI